MLVSADVHTALRPGCTRHGVADLTLPGALLCWCWALCIKHPTERTGVHDV
jgi:hypothetical protein